MVLEAEPCPDVVPIFVSGFEKIMDEERPDPRWLPRAGANVEIRFGERLQLSKLERFRERWHQIRAKAAAAAGDAIDKVKVEGNEMLMNGKEAVQLRTELALYLRGEVDKLRRLSGEPEEEDPKMGTAAYWKGTKNTGGP
jgi:monolysocardiolipin acyltransferase